MAEDKDVKIDLEITEIECSEPKKLRGNCIIHEIPPGTDAKDYWREHLSKPQFAEWLEDTNPLKNQLTDEADSYKVYHHKKFENPRCKGFTTIDVLQTLWGQPWNNLALRYVSTLRPDCVRVSNNGVTMDAHPWRVTVSLEKDNRTIRSISQEVDIDSNGARHGHDLNCQLLHQKEHGNLDDYEYYCDGIFVSDDVRVMLDMEIIDEEEQAS